jgi:hypothetical protein
MPSTMPGNASGSDTMTSSSQRTACRRRTTIQLSTKVLPATALALPMPTTRLFQTPATVSSRVATAA